MSERIDDMTRFVRTVLNREHASGSGWDLPSDAVWDGIAGSLQRRRKRRWVFWLAMAGFVAIAVSAYLLRPGASSEPAAQDPVSSQAISEEVEQGSKHDRVQAPEKNTDVATGSNPAASEVTATSSNTQQALQETPPAIGTSPRSHTAQQAGGEREKRTVSADQPVQATSPAGSEEKDDQAGAPQNVTDNVMAGETSGSGLRDTRDMLVLPVLPGRSTYVTPSDDRRPLPVMDSRGESTVHAASSWTVGVFVAPSLGTRHIAVGPGHAQVARMLLRQQETPTVRLSLGLSAAYA
ncbi:MAG: hypothetical protein R3330_14015, partial [Saprospiraceae bacterium]|nr:hypothetical protein [Saprospiraceae bacterium]